MRRPHSRPAIAPVSSAAATMPTVFAAAGKRAMVFGRSCARDRCGAAPRAAGARQEAAASAADAAGAIARRRDGAGGGGELSDRAGQGAAVVAGWLSRAERAIDNALLLTPPSTLRALECGISPGAASERDGIESLSRALSFVMPGLDPGIHDFFFCGDQDLDGRVKPGHDGGKSCGTFTPASPAPASRPRPAPSASLPRYPDASAPCRNWWSRRCCSSARTSTPPRSP